MPIPKGLVYRMRCRYLCSGGCRRYCTIVNDIVHRPVQQGATGGRLSMKLLWLAALVGFSVLVPAQEVDVSGGKGSVVLSINAQKTYNLMTSEKKQPVLTVQCTMKGKKPMHLVTFTAIEALAEGDPETAPKNGAITLHTVIGGKKGATLWIPYGDTVTFAYYGKTEPERVEFLHQLLTAPTASIEFTPFLTGSPETSIFDLSQLKEEIAKHSECNAD